MTKKQKLFFQHLPHCENSSEAARKAGYAKSSCRVSAHRNLKSITTYNDFLGEVFVQAKIDTPLLAKVFKEGLSSDNENIRLKFLQLALDNAKLLLTQDSEEIDYEAVNAEINRVINDNN